jgi:hypothetical protein
MRSTISFVRHSRHARDFETVYRQGALQLSAPDPPDAKDRRKPSAAHLESADLAGGRRCLLPSGPLVGRRLEIRPIRTPAAG